jgi:hypothetical protein
MLKARNCPNSLKTRVRIRNLETPEKVLESLRGEFPLSLNKLHIQGEILFLCSFNHKTEELNSGL